MVTYQLTPQAAAAFEADGCGEGTKFSQGKLHSLVQSGDAFTGGSGPGIVKVPRTHSEYTVRSSPTSSYSTSQSYSQQSLPSSGSDDGFDIFIRILDRFWLMYVAFTLNFAFCLRSGFRYVNLVVLIILRQVVSLPR